MTEIVRPHAPNGMQMNFLFLSQVKVAVKQVSNDDLDSLHSLQRELNILSKLRSEYIVNLYGSVVDNRDQASFTHDNGQPLCSLEPGLFFRIPWCNK